MVEEWDSDGVQVPDTWTYWECYYDDVPYTREYTNDFGEADEMGGSWPTMEEDIWDTIFG